jgi:DTW domain-containing protein YfiP
MRSSTSPDMTGRCRRCYLLQAACLCAELPTIPTRTQVLVVRHALESWKTTNTARFAQLAMPNLRILEYGGREPMDPAPILEPGTWLVFPQTEAEQPTGAAPRQIVVLDGTWAQARRMMKRYPAFRGLPRLALPLPKQPWRNLRQAPFPGALSTLEAIGEALRPLEGDAVAEQLRALNDQLVTRVLAVRGRRRRPDEPVATVP